MTGVSVFHASGLKESGGGWGVGSGLGVHLLEGEGKYPASFEEKE